MNKLRKIVFIIGNGFDLDLGRPTSYKSFWESEFCPKDYPTPIIQHLNSRWPDSLEGVKWYDMENELLAYYQKYETTQAFPDIIDKHELDFLSVFDPKVNIYGCSLTLDVQILNYFQSIMNPIGKRHRQGNGYTHGMEESEA